MTEFTNSDISNIARQVLEKISGAVSSSPDTAAIVSLSGDLGAGKTTLVQEIAKQLGVTETVISPTFTIMKAYDVTHDTYTRLVHIDAYRLKSSEELSKLGWNDIVSDPKNIVFIEWPEQVPELMDAVTLKIMLSHKDEIKRVINILTE